METVAHGVVFSRAVAAEVADVGGAGEEETVVRHHGDNTHRSCTPSPHGSPWG